MKRFLIIYCATPISLAIYNGARGTMWAPELGAFKTTLLFIGCAWPLWLVMGALAHGLLPLCRRLGVRPIWALVVPWLASIPVGYADVILFIHAFGHWFPGLDRVLIDDTTMVGGFSSYFTSLSSLMLLPIWLLAQLAYEWGTREKLFFSGWLAPAPGVSQALVDVQDATHVASIFLQKLRPDVRVRVLALEAQEHYVKVYGEGGEDFVLYRFGDAVAEIGRAIDGLQVHRSYWVAEDAVTAVAHVGKTYRLTLRNGVEVPVSLSYRGAIQQHRIFQQFQSANDGLNVEFIRAS